MEKMRYILIDEGFESKNYRGTIEADNPEQALLKLVNAGHSLQGTMLLACVSEGAPSMHALWEKTAGFIGTYGPYIPKTP